MKHFSQTHELAAAETVHGIKELCASCIVQVFVTADRIIVNVS